MLKTIFVLDKSKLHVKHLYLRKENDYNIDLCLIIVSVFRKEMLH